jgi:pimeloyl-ACP methyl ester carboxylesterase
MKKNKTLFLLLLFSYTLNGQSDFAQVWDSLYRDIKHQGSLNTSYFWNLGLVDSSLYASQGFSSDSFSDYDRLSNLHQKFYNSSIQPIQGLQTYEEFQKNLESSFKAKSIAVPILFLKAGMLKESAFKEGAIQFDSSNYRWQVNSPNDAFKIQEVFIAAPYIPVVFSSSITLRFSDEFIVNTSGSAIKRIRIKFRNEPYTDVQMNLPLNFVLLPGDNEVYIEVSFMDGKIRESKTSIAFETRDLNFGISNKHAQNNPFHFGDEQGNIYAIPERETEMQEPLGAFIDYMPGLNNGIQNTCIKKPLVIVEGIDFGYKDHWTGCYGGKCGNTGLIDLMNGYILNPYEAKLKNRIEAWAVIEKAPKFISELRSRGYDVFYIDFHNGAEYMENNAQVVVKFIQLLNERKCSDEELVVVGTSMGGVIAKYALSYMEKHHLPHCVRTYLSFDAPHQGANIPHGLQTFMQFYSGKLPTIRENFRRKLDRAATRQLLSMHVLSEFKTSQHKDRSEFLEKQNQLGNYPKLSRNIALTNGSVDASFQNFNPGDLLLTLNPFSAYIENNPINFSAYVFAMSRKFQQNTWTKPVNISFYSMLPFGRKYFVPLDLETGEDHIPGSLRYDLRDFKKIYGVINIVNNHSSTCFIPTASALDVTSKVGQKIDDYVDRFVPNPSVYPFHTFYGVENTNQEHMQLTDGNIQWVIDEIEKNKNEHGVFLNTVYNYGRYERYTLPSLTVQSQGKLQINAHGLNGFGNGVYDRMNRKGSRFEMKTSECNSLVVVEQGGMLELGSDNAENNKAILRIRKGCTLMLKSGSTLLIHDNSELIIEEGAQLVYFPGTIIRLEGNEATLQIDGKLRLETNAVFSISKGNSSNTGYIKFRNAKGGYGEGMIEIGGENTEIKLEGTSRQSDVVLQVEGEMNLISDKGTYALSKFSLSNCKVLYGNRSTVKLSSDLSLENVEFNKLPWAVAASSSAIEIINSSKAKLLNCVFSDFNFGVKCLGTESKSNEVKIERCRFSHCVNGFYASEFDVQISYSHYFNCIENGLYVLNAESDLKMTNTGFNGNASAAIIDNKTGKARYTFVESCDFGKNKLGLSLNYLNSVVACSRFSGNEIGLKDENGYLNLSQDKQINGSVYSSAGGNNTFAYNSHSGVNVTSSVLYLNNGKNNFLQSIGNRNCNFILGDVVYTQETHETISPYQLKASNNYWKDAPFNGNISNGAMSLYYVKFSYPNSNSSTMNFLAGDLYPNLNKICFNGSACNPCNLVLEDDKNKNSEQGQTGNNDSLNFKIYPFPASNYVELELPVVKNGEQLMMRLIDIQGRVLYHSVLTEAKTRIPTSEYSNGVYFLELSTRNQKVLKRVLINHLD